MQHIFIDFYLSSAPFSMTFNLISFNFASAFANR
jgi:hypothetical protein